MYRHLVEQSKCQVDTEVGMEATEATEATLVGMGKVVGIGEH